MRLDPAGISLPTRRRRATGAGLLAGICGLALLAAGCSSGGNPSASSTITIAAIQGIDDAPIYLAQKDGIFSAAGLHVQIKAYPNDAAEISAIQSGQADIAASDFGNVFYAEQQQSTADLKILANGYDATSGVLEVLTLPGSSITSPVDLEGQRVAVPSYDVLPVSHAVGHPVSLESAAAEQALYSYLAANSNTVTWVPMPEQDEVTALKEHKFKAILVSEPYVYQAQSQLGAVEVLDACSGATANLPLAGYAATKAWVRDHPAAVSAFQSALARAQAQASMAGPIQTALHQTGMSAQEAAMVTIGTFPASTNASDLQRVARLMFVARLLKNQPGVSPMLAR